MGAKGCGVFSKNTTSLVQIVNRFDATLLDYYS
jgi:hypothetical protein